MGNKYKPQKSKPWLAMVLCLLVLSTAGCTKAKQDAAESTEVSINTSATESEETTLPSEDISEGTVTVNGADFTGTLKNGKPWQGTVKYKDGVNATLDMDTKTITYGNGNVYVGDITDLQRNGNGVLTYKNGDKYDGEWRADKIDGDGTFTYANGDTYTGAFENNLRHGQGKFSWASGDVYEGSFTDDYMDGYGVYTWANGDRYEGYFKMDLRHGNGTLVIKTGDKTERYEGEWSKDKKHGNGILEYYNGDRYSGPFINGLPDTRTLDENGNFVVTEDGKYQHDVEATYTYSAGNYYTGYFEAGKMVIDSQT